MNAHLRFMSRRLLTFVFAVFISIISFARSKTVTSKIVDQVTATNSAEPFIIATPSVLSISHISYGIQDIKVRSRASPSRMNKHLDDLKLLQNF